MAPIDIGALSPKCRYLVRVIVNDDGDDAERSSELERLPEQRRRHIGRRRGHDVEIGRRTAQEKIPDDATDKIGLPPRRRQAAYDLETGPQPVRQNLG
jgi:hypothetical protein